MCTLGHTGLLNTHMHEGSSHKHVPMCEHLRTAGWGRHGGTALDGRGSLLAVRTSAVPKKAAHTLTRRVQIPKYSRTRSQILYYTQDDSWDLTPSDLAPAVGQLPDLAQDQSWKRQFLCWRFRRLCWLSAWRKLDLDPPKRNLKPV